jgi:hypothetical protein
MHFAVWTLVDTAIELRVAENGKSVLSASQDALTQMHAVTPFRTNSYPRPIPFLNLFNVKL